MAPVSAKSGGSVSALAAVLRRRRKSWLLGMAAILLLVLYPFVIGNLVARAVAARIGSQARPAGHHRAGAGRAGAHRAARPGFVVGDGDKGREPSPAKRDKADKSDKGDDQGDDRSGGRRWSTADEISVPFSAAWGGSPITVLGLHVIAVRGGDSDNVSDIIARLRGKRAGSAERPRSTLRGTARRRPPVVVARRARRQRHDRGARLRERPRR